MQEGLLTLYSEVEASPIHWLWYPYIAIGKITLLQGDPGDGKSTMMMNLIAEITTGGAFLMASHWSNRRGLSTSAQKMGLQIQ